MKFLFISPVVWGFYKLQNQSLPEALSLQNHNIIYLNPVKYWKWQKNIRFADVSQHPVPENVSIKERHVWLPKSLAVLIYENLSNLFQVIKNKPDVVICYDHLMGIMACLYCFFSKTKYIFNVSDDWDNVPQNKTARFFWKYIAKPLIIRFSDTITSISHHQYALFSKKNKKTFLLPNGKDMAFLEKLAEIEATENTNTIVFIGNLRPWYDFDLLFEIFNDLPDMELHIYGLGPLYKTLKKKSEAFKNIKLKGNIPYSETPLLLKKSFCGIIPLKGEVLNDSTCPLKVFDYWAAQKAVIATPTKELKTIGEDCILFASDKESYITHINFLKHNPERKNYLGMTGFDKIERMYNYRIIADTFLKMLN